MAYDLVIKNGTIITCNLNFDIIRNGFIGITNGRIQRIGPAEKIKPQDKSAQIIDAQGGFIVPGLINTHTHLPMTIFRGLADDLPLQTWLQEYIFPAEADYIRSETVKTGTLLACAEMILSGTTTCCDGYFFENEIAQTVQTAGLRAILGQGVIDFPAPGVPDPAQNVTQAIKFMDRWKNNTPLIIPSVFCHTPYTCTPDTLESAKQAAIERNLLFQIHVAETKEEWQQFQSKHHTTPIQFLDRLNLLDENTLLVHAIWVNDLDIETIASCKATISHNPQSNMKLASGIAPVTQFLAAGIAVGIGTDGCASNNDLDLLAEMDSAAKLHKVRLSDPTVMDAATVLHMATLGGAKALGLEDEIGSLEIGKQADIIIIDCQKPHLFPAYHPVSHLVYAANGADVRDVLVAGKLLMQNRKLLTLDIEAIMRAANNLKENVRQ